MLTSASTLAVVLIASAASADVTPQEVWDNWQAMTTSAGQELTVGATTPTAKGLEVTDVQITFKDQMGGSSSVSFDRLGFADNGDGTVAVSMPDSYPISLAFPAKGEGPGSLKLTVSQPGVKITAGGSATETSYQIEAPSMAITLDEVTDEAGKVLDTDGDLAMTDLTANYLVSQDGGMTVLDTSFGARAAVLTISGQDTESSGSGKAVVSFADLTGTTSGNFLNADLGVNLAAALNSGFTMESTLGFGTMSMDFDIVEPTGPTKMVANAGGGGFTLKMDKTRMVYGTSLQGARFVVSGAEIPFPQIEVGFADSAFNVQMPVSKSDTPQDFAFLTKVVDLTVSEDIWNLFDPGASLSREPATFILDTKGSGFWNQDIMDPEVDINTIEAPGELHSFDLTQFLLKAAGAEVAAAGALTFDNTDIATFDGVPRPEGLITVGIKGVNKLVENLIALGILTDDDAMGFRMAMAMFARPGAGPDELTSEIEFKDGGLFANGQQLQ
jgi:Uncharacterized protein conserved in bacteria (DUF2125)